MYLSIPVYVWTLYGINTVFFSLALYRWNKSDLRNRLRAKATVIDVIRHEEYDIDLERMSHTYSPIFRFVDSRTGKEVVAESPSSPRVGTFLDDKNTRSSYYPIGKTFNILYKPENPSDDVKIDSFSSNGSLSCVILTIFGGIVTLVSILYMLR
jgi:hypothetical protein